jgi:hypothetical protein
MSYTEIFGFGKEGNAYFAGETPNSHRGAMMVWRTMEQKYLPPLRFSRCSSDDEEEFGQVIGLYKDPRVSLTDKIVLMTTFDKVLVKKEDLLRVILAFEVFEGETSLKEQAVILRRMFDDDKCIAVGWNQTSVNSDTWVSYNYDEEKEEHTPYNCLKQNDHWWLFDEIKEEAR